MKMAALNQNGERCTVRVLSDSVISVYYLPDAGIAENAEKITKQEAQNKHGYDYDCACDALFDLPLFNGESITAKVRHILVKSPAQLVPMAERKFRIKTEYLDDWTDDAEIAELIAPIVDGAEVERLASEWGVDIDDLLRQVDELM